MKDWAQCLQSQSRPRMLTMILKKLAIPLNALRLPFVKVQFSLWGETHSQRKIVNQAICYYPDCHILFESTMNLEVYWPKRSNNMRKWTSRLRLFLHRELRILSQEIRRPTHLKLRVEKARKHIGSQTPTLFEIKLHCWFLPLLAPQACWLHGCLQSDESLL